CGNDLVVTCCPSAALSRAGTVPAEQFWDTAGSRGCQEQAVAAQRSPEARLDGVLARSSLGLAVHGLGLFCVLNGRAILSDGISISVMLSETLVKLSAIAVACAPVEEEQESGSEMSCIPQVQFIPNKTLDVPYQPLMFPDCKPD
ncbi:hypothetical protein IHE44_0011836, partial [Lamprotornis superbus]